MMLCKRRKTDKVLATLVKPLEVYGAQLGIGMPGKDNESSADCYSHVCIACVTQHLSQSQFAASSCCSRHLGCNKCNIAENQKHIPCCSLMALCLGMNETHRNIEASQLLHAFLLQDPMYPEWVVCACACMKDSSSTQTRQQKHAISRLSCLSVVLDDCLRI